MCKKTKGKVIDRYLMNGRNYQSIFYKLYPLKIIVTFYTRKSSYTTPTDRTLFFQAFYSRVVLVHKEGSLAGHYVSIERTRH